MGNSQLVMTGQTTAAKLSAPPGWVEIPLGEVTHLIRGVSYPKAEASPHPRAGYAPLLRATNIRAEGLVLEANLIYVPQKYIKTEQRLQVGDVLVCMSSGSEELVGKAAQLTGDWPGSCGVFCTIARFKPGVEAAFAGYFFRSDSYRRLIRARVSGVNINNLRRTDLLQLPLPLPPLPEQQRLVTIIERYFSRLDAGVAALERVQTKLGRYKNAVVQAAVTGRLLSQDSSDEPAAQLLQRLPGGHQPENLPDLPPLPSGWGWAPLSAISDALAGYAFKSQDYSAAGFQIVKIGNVGRGKLNVAEKPSFISQVGAKVKEKYLLQCGDILITLTGTRRKRDYGLVALVEHEAGLLLNQRVARLRFHAPLHPQFFLLALQGDYFQNRFFQYETGNVGQGNVRIGAIIHEAVPVPPLAEQARIVAEVERRLMAAARLEAVVEATLKRTEQLRQAILERAFSGWLSK
jgi:type I restriction enzyme, S subunit